MNIYELLGLGPDASKKDVYNKVLEYVDEKGKDSKEWQQIQNELEKYMRLGTKEAYDATLSDFDKENAELFSIVQKNSTTPKKPFSNGAKIITSKNHYNFKRIKGNLIEKLKKLGIKKITSLTLALTMVVSVGGAAASLSGCSIRTDGPDISTTQNYVDEDTEKDMEKATIKYEVQTGDFNASIIAKNLGISTDELELLDEIGQPGTKISINVPKETAEKYNYENLSKDHFICNYTTGNFSSLIDVAYNIIEEYPAFAEGKEYNKDGRTPANYLAVCLISDNPNMGDSLQTAQEGVYTLNFYGTDQEYDQMVKEGKLPTPEAKSITQK